MLDILISAPLAPHYSGHWSAVQWRGKGKRKWMFYVGDFESGGMIRNKNNDHTFIWRELLEIMREIPFIL